MSFLNAFSFASPFLLAGLAALPALWFLLRVTPPSPNRIPFPPLILIRRLMREESAPARIPLWILLLRMAIAAAVILAMSGPVYEPQKSGPAQSGPLMLYVETGWPTAPDWQRRMEALENLIKDAERDTRPILLLTDQDQNSLSSFLTPSAALEKLRALQPLSFRPDRSMPMTRLCEALRIHSDAALVIASDHLAQEADRTTMSCLTSALGDRQAAILGQSGDPLAALSGLTNDAEGLKLRIIRADATTAFKGRVLAQDQKGRNLGEAQFEFSAGRNETRTVLTLPNDLRNEIQRVDIAGMKTAGAVTLIDDSTKRRRIGIVSSTPADLNEPLLAPEYYLARALQPRADLREPRQGIAESIATLIDEKNSVIILADIGSLPADIEGKLQTYINDGGMVIRFAGPRLANAETRLLPVKLRGTGRALQSALSWETPQRLSPFERSSPFFGLTIPDDVTVSRQLLAEPDTGLVNKTWAALSDGTPIVTGERQGKGLLVLFHVTADTSWSSLPLSGLFLEMLDRLTSQASREATADTTIDNAQPLAPIKLLDGYGQFVPPTISAKPVTSISRLTANADHPAGLYGDPAAPFAVNVLDDKATLVPIDLSALAGGTIALDNPTRLDLAPILILIAASLFAVDGLASLIRARGRRFFAFSNRVSIFLVLLCITLANGTDAHAASEAIAPKDRDAALQTRLAYVVTGVSSLDEISRAGLDGLSRILRERTSFEPGDPVAVDIGSDDLAVYPLLYWPVSGNQPVPSQEAMRRIDRFMKNGGTIIFDTRDAALQRADGNITPETEKLRLLLAGLSVPPLEPLPEDHVLTKAFYLIDNIIGRTANGSTWIEALPKARNENDGPARAGDGVSPILITGNDLAAAWAMDDGGSGLLPLDATIPRQREMALRGGVNLVMYVLTGNYKADQVHIPALLERLGQ